MNTTSIPATFEEAEYQHLLFYSRVTCVIAIILVLAGVGLDMTFYPQEVGVFALARVGVSALIGLTLWSYSCPVGEAHVRVLTHFWISLPQLMIAWMIYHTDGEASIYFVGLTFAISGIGIFLPLSRREALGLSVFTLGIYVLACMLRAPGVRDWATLAGRLIFMLFYGVIAVTIAIYSGAWRRRTYELQTEVRAQKDALIEQNRALAAVKGQLIQREKMAAIGTLSAGLLHELNNPVNYSLMAVNMGLGMPAAKADPLLRESLDDAREGLTRVQNIVSDLKIFAYQKPGEDTMRPFLLEHAVRSAVRLDGYELKGIEVTIDLPQDTHVLGDEPAIIGVLVNLLSNAALALKKVRREPRRIAVRVVAAGERLRLSVRDNGCGIEPALLGRVFEPFFTTRDVGAGLGLGLSVSYGIVQRHGGTLSVESVWGEWTEFSFDLPRPAP